MKKYMIRCDIEGVSGVVSYSQVEPDKSEYSEGRKYFMSDLLALVNGLLDGGADEVHIYDEHFYGRNIELEKLPEKTFVYCGKPPYTSDWAGGLDETFQGLILLGFHSKRGTENALLNHTYEPDIKDMNICGISVGEIGIETAVAGSVNVPLLMVCADSEGCFEAKQLVTNVKTVSVKKSFSEFGAMCYPLETTKKMIYNAALEIVKNSPKTEVLKFSNPTILKVEFFETPFKQKYIEKYSDAPIVCENALFCFAEYLKRKFSI